ncbi:terminase [Rhodococcus sp. BH5]|uniref:terminase n=1 Tax=Rhodococcus sp. BH5 TaxID=2871702 RepID=UPI0022CD6827|nr:terminase [Rhodococcus sp. BH5]MCZ9635147.1 terminase [Rhodococcus sp. BH5]
MSSAEVNSKAELLPGYWIDPSGAWRTIPWPGDPCKAWNHPDRMAELPSFSLGPALIRFAEKWFVNPTTGQPWTFTPGQKMFLVLAYAADPNTGRWLYRSAVKRGAKGTGKDPFGACICLLELVGPSQVGRAKNGRLVGIRHRLPLVQIAANSEAQGKDVLRVANAMVPEATRQEFDFDCGDTRTTLKRGGRIELLTASQKTAEGDPATHIMLNESHHMTESSGGHDIAAVARRNVGKSPRELQARVFEYTNAHRMGSDAVAEQSFGAWQDQQHPNAKRRDILYDSIEAPPDTDITDEESLRKGLAAAYMDAPWSDPERLEGEVLDARTTTADTIRYYLNGLAAAADAWVDPRKFITLARGDLDLEPGDQISLFLDCSKSEDATALVAARLSDGFVKTLGMWAKPPGWDVKKQGQFRVDRDEVDDVVRRTFDLYKVVWFGVDPSPAKDDEDEALYWIDLIDAWHRDFSKKLKVWATPGAQGHSVKFDMRLSQRGGVTRNQQFTEQAQLVVTMIDEDGTLLHDGDPRLVKHVHNAKMRGNRWGTSLGKKSRDSGELVDLAVCMVGALLGRRLALNSNKVRTSSGTGRVLVLS